MKKVLIILLGLWGFAYGQSCETFDTVRNNAVSMITYNSARINGTITHIPSGAFTSIQLKYVRVGQTDTVTNSGLTPLRNITGLQASTTYYYYYKNICPSNAVSQTIGAYSFTTLSNTIQYVDERPTRFHYVYADSLLQIPSVDTSLYRAPEHPSIVYKSSDDIYYAYHLDCSCWQPLAVDSSGIIGLLDQKVDSVTISGDSLFYWKVGVSYGYVLPSVATVWHTTGGNSGIDTATDFLGTSDAVDLVFKTNDTRQATINASGALGFGDAPDYGTSGYVLKTIGSGGPPVWVNPTSLSITIPLNSITAATGTNTINNAAYKQEWQWPTLVNGEAMVLSSTSTVGNTDPTILNIQKSGVNSNSGVASYGIQIGVSNSGTTSINTGLSSAATGATTNNAIYLSASGGTNNHAINVNTGDVLLTPLTASLPLKLNSSKVMISEAIALGGSEISGILLGANGGTGVANTGKTITLGGNLTTSGAYNTTFTVTGSNNITFPNASITVARIDAAQTFAGLQTFSTAGASAKFVSSGYVANTVEIADPDGSTYITNGQFKVLTVPMVLNANASYITLQTAGVERMRVTNDGVIYSIPVTTDIDLSVGTYNAADAGLYHIRTGDVTNSFNMPDATTMTGKTIKVIVKAGESAPITAAAGNVYDKTAATLSTITAGTYIFTSNGVDWWEF